MDINKLREDFLQFIPVTYMTGNFLAQVSSLKNIGIKLNYIRGQGYDGVTVLCKGN